MAGSIFYLTVRLFRWRKQLLARFVATSLGRAFTSMAVIFFVREFLSSMVGEQTGFNGVMTSVVGSDAVRWVSAGLLLATYLLGALFFFDNQIVIQRMIKVIELGFMDRLIRHLFRLSVPFADRQSHGDIIQTIRMDVSQTRNVVHALANMVLEGFIVIGLIAMAAWISPSLAVWVLVALPILSLPVFLVSQRIRIRSHSVRSAGYVLFDMILEILKGMRVIKTFRGEEIQTQTAIEKGDAYFQEMIHMIRLQALSRVGMESLAGLSVVIVVLVGGFQVVEGKLSWPAMLSFLMAIRVMHTPLHMIHKQYVEMQSWCASVRRIEDFLTTQPQVADRPDAGMLPQSPRLISCKDVGFSYDSVDVLKDISFEVTAGETIGIVGPSGAGKSTLLNLIIRLYDPVKGQICFDGQDIRQFHLADIYDMVSIVAQDPFLFSTSVRENIRCGRPEATDEEVEAAARAAYIHDEIVDMPDGYDSLIGVGGRDVSRGQAQRISVARAFLKNSPILLLDEATSSLDSVAEANLQQSLDQLLKQRTSFVVAHRLSTLRNADRLLVLDRGRLVGDGPHEQLLRECDIYQQLWESQQLIASDA